MRRMEAQAENACFQQERQIERENQDAIIRGLEAFRPFSF